MQSVGSRKHHYRRALLCIFRFPQTLPVPEEETMPMYSGIRSSTRTEIDGGRTAKPSCVPAKRSLTLAPKKLVPKKELRSPV